MPKGHPKGFASGYQPRKRDDERIVDLVRHRYADNRTQIEIAEELGWSLKKVQGVFRRNGIITRRRVKRDQRGAKNSSWKGDRASYKAMHQRLYATRGRPFPCSVCGTTTARAYDWANLTGHYANPMDYAPMCRSCHWRHDGTIRNLRRKEVMPTTP